MKKILILLSGILILSPVLLNRLFPPNLSRLQDVSVVVYDQERNPLHVFFSSQKNLWCLPVQLKDVDPSFIEHLIAIEDQRFWSHWGVDPRSLMRAFYQVLRHRRVISGGSTLTMQTVRLLEPRPRTVLSKCIEILRAWQLEWYYSKTEILEMYLTLAPYGGNITGVRAASMAYFDHMPDRLTPAESSLLVTLPRSPTRLRPDRAPDRLMAVRNRVLKRLFHSRHLSKAQFQEARAQPVPQTRYPFPRKAPHLSRRLRFSNPQESVHETFIDSSVQRSVKEIVEAAMVPRDDASVAVLVVDNETNKVRAYVGSRNFWSIQSCGQVDCIRAIRSPGSTLKPFIYGMGFDQGLIHPKTLLKDIPQRHGAYSPSNFDHNYSGELTVAQALRRSLNIPVVTVLNVLGPLNFTSTLQQSGVRFRMPAKATPNLSIALGGLGMTLEELVLLYASLAHHGEGVPLQYSSSLSFGHPCQLFTSQSAQHLRLILAVRHNGLLRPHNDFALKTGTSHGHRDAWAIGVGEDYTVGVWVGCPDGSSLRGATGYSAAVPILNKVFQSLPYRISHPVISSGRSSSSVGYQLNSQAVQTKMGHGHAIHIQFPVNGSVLQVLRGENGAFKPVPLLLEEESANVTWLINGQSALLKKERHRTLWVPPSVGFYSLVAIDSTGHQARVEIEVQEG